MDRKGIGLREAAGMILLVALLILGLLSAWRLDRQHTDLAQILEDSSWLALSGQWDTARQQAADARSEWQRSWRFRAVLASHSPMEEIDALFQELAVCGAAGERTEFSRLCANLAQRLRAMAAAGSPRWWNIL